MKKTQNMTDLVENLMRVFDELRKEMKADKPNLEVISAAYAAAAIAGKVITGIALQLEYEKRLGQVPILDTMATPKVKQITA